MNDASDGYRLTEATVSVREVARSSSGVAATTPTLVYGKMGRRKRLQAQTSVMVRMPIVLTPKQLEIFPSFD